MIWTAAIVAAGISMAAWAVRAANAHRADAAMVERLAVAMVGAAGVLTALAAVLRAV